MRLEVYLLNPHYRVLAHLFLDRLRRPGGLCVRLNVVRFRSLARGVEGGRVEAGYAGGRYRGAGAVAEQGEHARMLRKKI